MANKQFDLIVLGTGPASSRITGRAPDDWKVAVVDARPLGGTCALRGCNPKKVLVRAAELYDWIQRSRGDLLSVDKVRIDWPQLIRFKGAFTDSIPESKEKSLHKKGMTTYQETARFTGANTIQVGEETIEGKHIVIATGAKPVKLNIPGEEHITTSDEFLEADELPEHVVFIGGGYVSFEFAHVAVRAGAKVTIIDRGKRPLNAFEPVLVDRLVKRSREIGIDMVTETEVEAIEKTSSSQLTVVTSGNGKSSTLEAGMVVHGAGRVPIVDELDLTTGNVAHDKSGIKVNDYLQSVSNQAVYAAGDVAHTNSMPLSPVASHEGFILAQNLFDGKKEKADYSAVPTVVFSVPALAAVGLREEQANSLGLGFDVRAGDLSEWNSYRKVGETCAAYKLLIDKKSDRILGAHLLGPAAEELINLFALAMKYNLRAKDLKSTLFAFPTFSADIRAML